MLKAEDYIQQLQLIPHPEGGFYRETYRATGTIPEKDLHEDCHGSRNFSTAIYFLLKANQVSHFHRIKSDEVWHFHVGAPLEIFELAKNGGTKATILGPNVDQGQTLQHIVPAGHWFAAHIPDSTQDAFTLVGCTVAPGFDFKDFTLATPKDLSDFTLSPSYRRLILSETSQP